MTFVAASAIIEMVFTGLRKAVGHAGAAWSRLNDFNSFRQDCVPDRRPARLVLKMRHLPSAAG